VASDAIVEQLRTEFAALVDLCSDLSERDWKRPTECPGWTVQDVLAHLLGIELGLLGEPEPEPVRGREHVRNELGEQNEAWVEHFRDRSGDAVLQEFAAVSGRRVAALHALPDAAMDERHPGPVGETSYRDLLGIRLMDCWVHEQDVRHALGRPGGFDGEHVAAVFERLLGALPRVVAKRVQPPEGSVVALRLAEPVPRVRAVEVVGGKGRLVEPERAGCTVSMAPWVHERLAAGRWSGQHAWHDGDLTVDGDLELGRALVDNLAILP